ncbi:host cell division inhibitor Icd-like protein [Escherichia coli]|nr:host cell division inhibitor Icd-like protein [Escherichia coli]EEZ2714183.1 host cell division inhibitor Icd-like protein [Escherichia coli]
MSIADNATFTAGGQGYQPGGRFLPDLSRRGYFSTKSSRAKRFCERFFTSGSGFNSSDSGSSLARLSSRWCSSMPYKSCLRCSAKISVMDLYFLFMLLPCKAMRRSTSHHGADSDYSDSLALRRWRRLISPCIDAMMNCDVLSPDSFTNSMSFTISCGTRAFRACDFAFVVPVAISIPLLDWWGTVYTEKAQIKLLTWATPKGYSGPHLEVIKVHKCKAPQVSLPLAGLLTTNDSNSIEVAMLNHTTHPQGRDSHNLNKYIWRFIALSTAQPRVITIEATSEQEARQQSPAGCVMVFAARIRQGVCHD